MAAFNIAEPFTNTDKLPGGQPQTSTTVAPTGDKLEDRLKSIMDIITGSGSSDQAGAPAPAPDPSAAPTTVAPAGHLSAVHPSASMASGDKGAYQQYAQSKLADYGWDASELGALIQLWDNESGWNPNAQNPGSTAYGIAQFLDSTWGSYGTKTSDPHGQIDAGLAYIKARYGSPSKALAFWNSRQPINGKDVGHWY